MDSEGGRHDLPRQGWGRAADASPPYAFMLDVSERGIELGGSFIRNIDYRAGHPERFTVSYAGACYTFVVSYGA